MTNNSASSNSTPAPSSTPSPTSKHSIRKVHLTLARAQALEDIVEAIADANPTSPLSSIMIWKYHPATNVREAARLLRGLD